MTSKISPLLYQELIHIHYPRRLLLLHHPPTPTPRPDPVDPTGPYRGGETGFEANVVMILSVLLCALICSLALNSIIKCALRCSTLSSSNNNSDPNPTRLPKMGIKKKALKSFATVSYDPDHKFPGLDTECVICLSEFCLDDKVRILPKCNHGFHVKCIDKWLRSHTSCPTCRHCLIDTCDKIIGRDYDHDSNNNNNNGLANSSQQQQFPIVPHESTIVQIIAPLEREDIVRCYRSN